MNHFNDDGTVNLDKLEAGINYSKMFVFPGSFYEKVGSLTDSQFRRFEHTLRVYEMNTGKPHSLSLKQGHSIELRITVPVPLTRESNVQWIGDVEVGNPAKSFDGQSLSRIMQMSKLMTKRAMLLDTGVPNMWIACIKCGNYTPSSVYDISFSSTGVVKHTNTSADFFLGRVNGDLVSDGVFFLADMRSVTVQEGALIAGITESPCQ